MAAGSTGLRAFEVAIAAQETRKRVVDARQRCLDAGLIDPLKPSVRERAAALIGR